MSTNIFWNWMAQAHGNFDIRTKHGCISPRNKVGWYSMVINWVMGPCIHGDSSLGKWVSIKKVLDVQNQCELKPKCKHFFSRLFDALIASESFISHAAAYCLARKHSTK